MNISQYIVQCIHEAIDFSVKWYRKMVAPHNAMEKTAAMR